MHCAFFSLECNSSSCPLCEGADPTIIAVTVLIVVVVLLTVILAGGVVYSQRRKTNHSRKHKERK